MSARSGEPLADKEKGRETCRFRAPFEINLFQPLPGRAEAQPKKVFSAQAASSVARTSSALMSSSLRRYFSCS